MHIEGYDFFIKTDPFINEYAGYVEGVFTSSGFCIFGIRLQHWQWLIVVFNIGFGFWKD